MKTLHAFFALVLTSSSAFSQDLSYSIPLGFGDLTGSSACALGGELSGGGSGGGRNFCIYEPAIGPSGLALSGGEFSGGGKITRMVGTADAGAIQEFLKKQKLGAFSDLDFSQISSGYVASPNGCAAVQLVQGCTCTDGVGGRPAISCAEIGIQINGLIDFPKNFGVVLPNLVIVPVGTD